MFSENTKKTGCIEVICGSMFSGKTEELIRRLKRAQFAKQKIEIFKPTIDKRYSDLDVVSHDSHTIPCTPIKTPSRMLNVAPDVEVIGIDEAQFFDESIIEVAQNLANRGVRVIVAGLDTDYLGKPFGPMPGLMAIAEDVQKVHARVFQRGPGRRKKRIVTSAGDGPEWLAARSGCRYAYRSRS